MKPTPRRRTPEAAAASRHVLSRKAADNSRPVALLPEGDEGLQEVFTAAVKKSNGMTRKARSRKYIHVSELLSKCIRRKALANLYDIRFKPEFLSLTDSLTFAQGEAIHDVLKERAAAGAPSEVWGVWSCTCGSSRTEKPCTFSEVVDIVCGQCDTFLDKYHEVDLVDNEYLILGHPDIILFLKKYQAYYVTELKSIAHERWKELARPEPDHVLQVLFYWWLMRRQGYRVTNQVSIVYATKGYMFKGSPIKEFVIDPSTQIHRLDEYLASAKAYASSQESGSESELPGRMCVSADDPNARKCEACSVCFGGDLAKPVTFSFAQASRR